MRRVKITSLPKKYEGGESGTKGGLERFMQGEKTFDNGLNQFSAPDISVNNSISAVPRHQANIEAEGGEFAVVPGQGGIPEGYNISGPRHAQGGVPLSLSDDSFIFSDHKKGMKIKDKEILAMFNAHKKSTPAELAKKYQTNEYKKILMDPNSDKFERETAEKMIQNYNMKQGQIALIQESMKGFPQGVPAIAMPYLQTVGADPASFMPQQQQQQMPQQMPEEEMMMAMYGAGVIGDPQQYSYGEGGGIHINPANKGKFTASAQRAGMGVQEFAAHVLANKEDYSSTQVKRANFARNASKWNHQFGGNVNQDMDDQFPGLDIMQDGGQKLAEFMLRIPGLRRLGANMLDQEEDFIPFNQQATPQVIQQVPGQTTTTTTAGAPVSTTTKTTQSTSIPKEYTSNPVYDQTSDKYDPSVLKTGDYVKAPDGKWRKVTYVPDVVKYEGEDYEKTFGKNEDVANAYAFLERSFTDPEVKKAFAEKTRSALKNKEYYKGKRGGYSEMYTDAEINAMSDDDLVNMFLKHQKRNYSLQANGFDPKHFTDANGKLKPDLDPETKKMYESRGIHSLNDAFAYTGTPITAEEQQAGHLGLQQGTYWGYHDLLKDKGNLDPAVQEKLKFFHEPQEGESDEPLNKTISPIDSKKQNFYTNTTAGHLAIVDQGKLELEGLPEDVVEEKKRGEIPVINQKYARQPINAQFWAQDIGNMANLFGQKMGLKKYLPHSFPVDLARPDVLYWDPSRAIANVAEGEKMAQMATQAFAGPQSTYRMTGVAGEAFKNKANVLADYEGRNVQVGNQYLAAVKGTADQEAMANAERASRLMDQWTTANQQYDNAERDINRKLFEGWRQALDNKWQTQAMNYMYPQFNTIPGIGGGMFYTGAPRPFNNTGTSASNGSDNYLAEFQRLKQQYPQASDAAIKQQLDNQYGAVASNNPDDMDEAQKRAFMQMYSGMVNPYSRG